MGLKSRKGPRSHKGWHENGGKGAPVLKGQSLSMNNNIKKKAFLWSCGQGKTNCDCNFINKREKCEVLIF